uniref:E3 ubiquitin-protein ligase MARCHF5 n=1 Tax=Schistocephalus solidus TaxID=70667 RepID=A0A0X3PY10_SCHSO
MSARGFTGFRARSPRPVPVPENVRVYSQPSPVPPDTLCWVCYCSEAEAPQDWIRPCRCCGSCKWVHQSCLQKWIDEKQQNSLNTPVLCSSCGYQYAIVYPPPDTFLVLLDAFDRLTDLTSSYLFGGLLVGCLYWSAVTYGAVTVMQVYGHGSGLNAMERTDPVILLVGLPAIPVILILCKFIGWQDFLLRLWRKHLRKMAPFRYLIPADIPSWRLEEASDPRSNFELGAIPRILCSALLLPTLSVFCGRVFFPQIESDLLRTLSVRATSFFRLFALPTTAVLFHHSPGTAFAFTVLIFCLASTEVLVV